MIRFFLNRETTMRTVRATPTITVLEYLRTNGFVGSKEGCAAGDCGACTAVLAENHAGRLRYTPINTCICFMSALDGKLLISVDGLANGDHLHPVQEAMASEHGSQCGFCTPGFVMSLFAITKHPPTDNTRESIAERLAGNLCRCTGYLPIFRAAGKLLAKPIHDDFNDDDILRRLETITSTAQDNDDIYIAHSDSQLAEIRRQHPDARLLGGGTDLALELTQREQILGQTIDISRLDNTFQDDGDCWRIGAAATVDNLLQFCTTHLPVMVPFLKRFGSPPIRARATIGGNIGNASPIGDLLPPFIALNASLHLTNGDKQRQLPLEDFFLGYKKTALQADEWISAVRLPKPPPDTVFKVYKISKRLEDDISAVCGAFSWRMNGNKICDVRLAFGGMAAIPKRALQCEQTFTNATWTEETFAQAVAALMTDFTPLSDMRASANYRLRAAGGILQRAYWETQQSLPRIESIWA